jgi:hypothetical protein
MSSAINIWDPAYAGGVPQTFEQADAVFQKFDSNELVGVNPKFIQFAEAVKKIVATELDVQEDIQDSFDGLVNAAERNQMALFRVGLPHDARVLGIEIVVRAAAETGLIAFDESMCAVFLPDGSVQPPDKAEMWFGALDYMRNPEEEYPFKIKDFKKLFLSKIEQLVEKNGMTKAKLSFVNSKGYRRQCGNVTQYLSTDVEGGGGYIELKFISIFFLSQSVKFISNFHLCQVNMYLIY